MIPIIFSIPIHEKLEVVLDQIINYKYFNPECGIVFHFSDKFDYTNSCITREEFEKAVQDIENVFLNPVSVRTEWCDIIQAHLSNFIYMKGQCEFEYFALCASNEMFIRRGLYQWIREYDCGMQCVEIPEATEWIHAIMAKKDMALKKILQDIGGEKIIASQVEGTFFKYGLFNDICEVINRNYDYKSMEFAYAREEIYFSTIVWIWKNKGRKINIYKNGTFTYMPREHCLKIKIDDIKHLRVERSQYFSVKRINRDLNDYVRNYIREEIDGGYYDYEMEIYISFNFRVALYDNKLLNSLLRFERKDLSFFLHNIINCLESVREYGSKEQFKNIISLLEHEYWDSLLESMLQGDLEILKLLVQINGIVCTYIDTKNYEIQPIHWLLLYVYEKALLKRIRERDEIALYGAGRYGEKFLEFLQKNNLSGKMSCFVVSSLKGNAQEINGIPVKKLSDFLQEAEEKRVFVTVAQKFQKEVEDCLCKNGYKNYEIVNQEFLQAITADSLYLMLAEKM